MKHESPRRDAYVRIPGIQEIEKDPPPFGVRAKAVQFTRCNRCGYIFKKLGVSIDMTDFHDHKQSCTPEAF